MKDVRPFLYNVLLLAFLGLLGWGLIRSPQWDWPHLVVCIVAAGFVALLGNMDRLESFKAGAGGIEAKTREVVAKAESAISELQMLGESVVAILFELIDGSGRWGGALSSAQKDIRKVELKDLLRRLGVGEARIEAASAAERKWAYVDYVAGITQDLPKTTTHNEAWNRAWEPWRYTLERPTVDELDRILDTVRPIEKWREELLEDLRFYSRTGKQRRPSVWADRDEWHDWTLHDKWPDRDH